MSEEEREGTAAAGGSSGYPPDELPAPGVKSHRWANLNAQHDALCIRRYGVAIEPGTGRRGPPDPTLSEEEFFAAHDAIHRQLKTIVPETR